MSKESAVSASQMVPTCRICGCTDDHACEGGCSWVEDPEGLGHLCSQCLANPDQIWQIPLEQIRPAPWNPPSRMDSKKVEELADSIMVEGQQSPALIRPVTETLDNEVKYEIVWGHRRYAAKLLLMVNDGGPGSGLLKCFIREMAEEQAMISSGVENLQREGFSDIEEAEFFRTCSERYGETAVKILAEKLSVSQPYIRKRLQFLKLPEEALAIWRSGIWHAGHMEQLLRLGENDLVVAFLKDFTRYEHDLKHTSVWRLKDQIGRLAVALHSGSFDKAECKVCQKNTDCQHRLFGLEKEKGAKCLDPKCFREKQQAWYDLNWAASKQNKFGTQAAIVGNYDTKRTGDFNEHPGNTKPGEKCLSCPDFSTIMWNRGDRNFTVYREQVCMGEASCFASMGKKGKQAEKKAKGKEPESPRVVWHGEHFRQEFYRQETPVLMANLMADDPRRLQLALAVMVHSARDLGEWLCGKVGVEPPAKEKWQEFSTVPFPRLLELTKSLNGMQAEILLAEAITLIAHRNGRGYETTFYDGDRQALAEFLDIDFGKFQVTEEYLQKKTKAELVRFIVHDSGLMDEPKFQEFMEQCGYPTAEKLAQAKKGALVDLILKCDVDLHGRLPKEIADMPKLQEQGD